MVVTTERVKKYREKMSKAGMRPVQIWVPDTREEAFAQECKRQSRLLADDEQEREILNFIESAADTKGWI